MDGRSYLRSRIEGRSRSPWRTFVDSVERTWPAGHVRIDAVILTKVDTDAKGGAALSIAKAVGKPILFLGVGQEYADIVPYDPQWMVDRIFEAA